MNKKIISIIFIVVFVLCFGVFRLYKQNAKTKISNLPKVKVGQEVFVLKHSNCNNKTVGCLNEYYLSKEKGYGWSELFTFHYLGNISDRGEYSNKLASFSKISDVVYDKQKDEYYVFLILPYTNLGNTILEQNIFRVMKNPYGDGSVALQYSYKHNVARQTMQEALKKTIEIKNKYKEELGKMPVPIIYEKELTAW